MILTQQARECTNMKTDVIVNVALAFKKSLGTMNCKNNRVMMRSKEAGDHFCLC